MVVEESQLAGGRATTRLAVVTSFRHRLITALALAAIGLSLGGCQKAISVGAVNRCGVDVEIQADTVREATTRWVMVRAGDQEKVAAMGENTEMFYVNLRASGNGEARSFDVLTTSLGKPPADVDYEALLVLEGDRCP
ncbi:hypothetical protein ABZ754_00245 [Micromonospora purpureochromogenes]|uniref:hypothetical protein n=1 Tax=Micromonospora purpureochromogenes TaxID=47872 RepID=UPI0033FCD050